MSCGRIISSRATISLFLDQQMSQPSLLSYPSIFRVQWVKIIKNRSWGLSLIGGLSVNFWYHAEWKFYSVLLYKQNYNPSPLPKNADYPHACSHVQLAMVQFQVCRVGVFRWRVRGRWRGELFREFCFINLDQWEERIRDVLPFHLPKIPHKNSPLPPAAL